jgi:hypothetical protein
MYMVMVTFQFANSEKLPSGVVPSVSTMHPQILHIDSPLVTYHVHDIQASGVDASYLVRLLPWEIPR